MRKKLLISDLDGTLVGKNKVLSENLKLAVAKWKEAGNIFVIATGRLLSSCELYADMLKSNEYIICCSGACAYKDKKMIFEETVSAKYVEDLWQIMNNIDGYVQVYSDRNLIANKRGGIALKYEEMNKNTSSRYNIPITYQKDYKPWISNHVNKLSFTFDTKEQEQFVLSQIKDLSDVNYFNSLSYLYDITSKKANKGLACKKLIEILGVFEEDTYVVGDNENDISMFDYFKNSYLVKSAPEKIMDSANNLIETPENDGLVNLIYDLI